MAREDTTRAAGERASPPDTREEFRRELRSLFLVYLALLVLPLLTGFACQS